MEKEFVFCYCLFAVSIFCDSTEFEHQISLNSESVYTPALYIVKNTSRDVRVIENNARGQQPLDLGNGINSTVHLDPFLFLRPSKPME